MIRIGADIEVNRAYIFRDDEWSAVTQVIKEIFTSVLGQYKSTMTSPFASGQRTRHCALANHLYLRPHAYYMLCVPG